MKIYVVRHGLTQYNKLKKINSQRIDEPLEPEGIVQAEETAVKLPSDIVKIYASPMIRTQQTAEIINKKLGLDIVYHPGLKEIDFGTLTERSWDDIKAEYGEDFYRS